jgi:hypothetical protein
MCRAGQPYHRATDFANPIRRQPRILRGSRSGAKGEPLARGVHWVAAAHLTTYDASRHLGAETEASTEGITMATVAPPRPAVFHLVATSPEHGIRLVDVEGELEASAVTRWSELFNGAIGGGATGIAVDLRDCRSVAPICLSVLVGVSDVLKARGGGGVKLVTYPGSPLGRWLGARAPEALPTYASASGALRSLGDAL